jgi:hypothetical protein
VRIANSSLYRCASGPAAENQRGAACYHGQKMPANKSHLPVNLLGQSAEELRAHMQALGEPAYRGAQIYRALYAERRFDVANMSNLPVALRQRLAREAVIPLPRIVRRYQSDDCRRRMRAARQRPRTPRRSKRCSCRKKIARRFVFPRRRVAPWIAIFA